MKYAFAAILIASLAAAQKQKDARKRMREDELEAQQFLYELVSGWAVPVEVDLGSSEIDVEEESVTFEYPNEVGDLSVTINDIGVNSDDAVDYPDIGKELSKKVQQKEYERGILVCGTGAGMAIVANKFSGVRAVCVNDAYTAERSIASNNAQIITFGALITGAPNAKMYTDIWLSNDFQKERSGKKVDKINLLDE